MKNSKRINSSEIKANDSDPAVQILDNDVIEDRSTTNLLSNRSKARVTPNNNSTIIFKLKIFAANSTRRKKLM